MSDELRTKEPIDERLERARRDLGMARLAVLRANDDLEAAEKEWEAAWAAVQKQKR